MSACKFIKKCSHATAWCRSDTTQWICEYLIEHLVKRKEDYMIEEQEKKVYFSCPYCDIGYEDPEDMANCTLRCKRNNLEKMAKEEREKLQEEKQNRREQILATRKELVELERKYRKDYGRKST